MRNFLFLLFIILLPLANNVSSQTYKLKLFVHHQANTPIILGSIQGDKFTFIDSSYASDGHRKFQLSNNHLSGVYRVILGQTIMAKVLNEPPQQLDFIFNGEDIEIETDFKAPLDSAKVIRSVENQVWFDFLRKEKLYQKQVKELEMQINHFQENNDVYYTLAKQSAIINRYNNLQKERSKLILPIIQEYPFLYASQLIKIKSEPFLDGNLSESERKETIRKHYFDDVTFSDEPLMNSSIYTDKVFSYFMLYAQKELSKVEQEAEFKKAIDVILDKTMANPNVSAFIVDYLMRGFEKLGLDNLQAYISENFMVPHGCSGDQNTLKRRLESQKMTIGTQAPDFNLSEIDGGLVNLYHTNSKYKLVLFWETTCPMCKDILPQLRSWYFGKSIDLEIFAISIDKDKAAWQEFVVNSNYPWFNLNEPYKWDGEVATAYNLYATPTMFLLDEENKILAKPIDFGGFLEAVSSL
ncbi:TlpA family protein disulfide reductase [Carboxylicivirga sp. N1Y90]|uniref:TlpA family protein disulfide reductase n=1 Tax=Carboxylicivirga fragile TaxID=3417571 RepID=UPI003D343CFA|nr:redoxin domain-containing protein [Marinilabiliaceae bacterium N1Y90]